MTALTRLGGITFDCADPRALAAFYREATGWSVSYDSDDYVFLDTGASTTGDGQTVGVGFQRVEGYRPPTWPGGAMPVRGHLDFYVADLAEAGRRLAELGATKAESQPGGDRWWVYLDPAGHPFCLAVPNAFAEDGQAVEG